MQPQTPEVAGVKGAGAVLGPAGQIRALDPRSTSTLWAWAYRQAGITLGPDA